VTTFVADRFRIARGFRIIGDAAHAKLHNLF